MRQVSLLIALSGASAACLLAIPQAQDQKVARSNMAQELRSRMVLSKFAGPDLRQAGTVLLVQKDGIGAVPGSGVGVLNSSFGSNYKDGRLRRDFISALVANKTAGLRNLAIGEGVYLLRVQVTDSNVVLDVQSCGACNPTTPEPNPMRATVTFPFKKGFLDNTSVDQVMAMIGEVFTFANGAPATDAPPPSAPPAGVPPPVTQAAVPPAQPEQEPAKIEVGQTLEQVQNILGRPEKVVDLGAKKIYLYKDLKITFVDGLVSDVQ
jgi:hypothetical protein